jgi:ABC-type phosphate transport system substrate-binding protein
VDGVAANAAHVVSGAYKIARPFILLYGKNVTAQSAAFVNWILSGAGQAIVKTSWIPVQ